MSNPKFNQKSVSQRSVRTQTPFKAPRTAPTVDQIFTKEEEVPEHLRTPYFGTITVSSKATGERSKFVPPDRGGGTKFF